MIAQKNIDLPSLDETANAAAIIMMACHHRAVNNGWWHDLETKEPLERNVGELLMLCVSELSEALEGHRSDRMDDKLPDRKMFDVELADAVIRIVDICGRLAPDFPEILAEKLNFNDHREDHKPENRRKEGGKKY